MKPVYAFVLILTFWYSCTDDHTPWLIRDLPPIGTPSTETPNLVLSPQNKLFLSWTEHESDTQVALKFAIWNDTSWSTSHPVARGKNWFVNWADFPSLAIFPGSELNMLAHFLDKRAGGSLYDYDIKLALTGTSGQQFRILDGLHDTVAAEHGFVTLLPFSYDKILVTWLDGGQMKSLPAGEHAHGHPDGGSMNLRCALVDVMGQITQNTILDDKVCECCQTDAAMTGKGPIIVYRNRDDQEHRDIYYTRYISGQWTNPRPVWQDDWKINGCPVNGPAISTHNNQVAIAWYTEAGGQPRVKLIISNDAGESFGQPVELSKNTLGRVDLVWLDNTRIACSYLEKTTDSGQSSTEIHLAVVSPDGRILMQHAIAETSSKRKSGFPVLETVNQKLYLAYTNAVDSARTDINVKEVVIQ